MTAASPYRSRSTPVSTLTVPAVAMPRPLWLVFLVVVGAPIALHLFSWSRVVTVRCERDEQRRIACDVDEVAIARSSHLRRDATGASSARVEGPVHRSRGDVHIALVLPGATAELTTGFNGDKERQVQVAARLTRFLQQRDERSVTLTFGDRWRAAWIFLGLDLLLVLTMYPIFGQRLRVTADRGRDTLDVRRRAWPLPGARVTAPLSRVVGAHVVEVRRGRYQLVAVTDDQRTFPLTWQIGVSSLLEPAAAALRLFLEEERARYRSAG